MLVMVFRLKLETRTKTCQFDRVFSLQRINISFFLAKPIISNPVYFSLVNIAYHTYKF